MKEVFFYVKYDNIIVLQTYLDTIANAFRKNGYSVQFVKDLSHVSKKDFVFFSLGLDVVKYYFKGYKNFGLWQQGVTADESYMRHKSKIRYVLLNSIDCFAMKKSKILFFVSEELKKHYESKAKKDFADKSYIMPCFNEQITKDFAIEKDYKQKSFCYVGSLSKWQCFDATVDLFLKIQNIHSDATLKVLTFQEEEAKAILEAKKVRNYIVKCVDKYEVKDELKDVSFGFVIREDNIINRVSTPTKFSSYLCAGVLPIYSECLRDYYKNTEHLQIGCPLSQNDEGKVIDYISLNHEAKEITRNIKSIFDNYYSIEKYESDIRKFLYRVLNSPK